MKNLLNDANNKLKVLTDAVRMDIIAAGIVPGAVVTLKNGEVHKVTGVSHYISSDKFYTTISTVKRIKSGAWGKRSSGTPLSIIETVVAPDADKTYELILEDHDQDLAWIIVKGNVVEGTPYDTHLMYNDHTVFPKDAFDNWCYRRDFRAGDYIGYRDGGVTLKWRITEVREL